jgi:malate dehydrogenase (oxaloacetate-decarboxylating)(NADP+)
VTVNGRHFVPRQGNNSYIFPGIGLGVIASGARRVTDEMFMGAAHALAELITEADLAEGSLYPSLTRIREVSAAIGTRVARIAYARALAPAPAPHDVFAHVRSCMYEPRYTDYAGPGLKTTAKEEVP